MLASLVFAGVVALGLLQIALGRWLARRTRALIARGRRAPARTIGATVEATIDMQGARYDQLEFTAEDGRVYPVASRIGVPWSTTRGRAVAVIYDPADPSEAVLDRWADLWLAPLIFTLGGALMIVAAVAFAALDRLGVIEANYW